MRRLSDEEKRRRGTLRAGFTEADYARNDARKRRKGNTRVMPAAEERSPTAAAASVIDRDACVAACPMPDDPMAPEWIEARNAARFDPHRDAAREHYFDPIPARMAVGFIETHLVHVKGVLGGQPLRLLPWERATIFNLFGWRRASDGLRRFRWLSEWIAKKNGKTTKAAAIALAVMFLDDEPGVEIYSTATTRAQAQHAWRTAAAMLMRSPVLRDRAKVLMGSKAIQRNDDPMSTYQPVAAEAGGAHGYNSHCVINDELHAHAGMHGREFIDTMITSVKARRQPIVCDFSTAGYDTTTIGYDRYKYAANVRDGIVRDARMLPVIYEPGEGVDWRSDEAIRQGNPSLGESVLFEDIDDERRRALRQVSLESSYRRFSLNQWVEQADRWIRMEDWDGCPTWSADLVKPLDRRHAYAGLDLAIRDDLAAYVVAVRAGEYIFLWPRIFVPADDLRERGDRDGVDYSAWRDAGFLLATPGGEIDFEFIRAEIVESAKRFRLQEVACDPCYSHHIGSLLRKQDGVNIFDHRQGFVSMTGPSGSFEKLVKQKKIVHNGHPVLRWNVLNAAISGDAAGNIKPDKAKARGRIDGLVAAIMAVGRLLAASGQRRSDVLMPVWV